MADNNSPETMQDSWVDVQERHEKGTLALTHTSSKEEMKQLLASAVSEEEEEEEEEEELLDSDVVYHVTFKTADEDTPERNEEEQTQVSPSIQCPKAPKLVSDIPPTSTPDSWFGEGICSLTFIVPVIILTHLAVFGLGYFLGQQRWSGEPSMAVMKMFHV